MLFDKIAFENGFILAGSSLIRDNSVCSIDFRNKLNFFPKQIRHSRDGLGKR